MENLENRNE